MRWCHSCLTGQTLRPFRAEPREIYTQGQAQSVENEAITPDIAYGALSVRSNCLFLLD
jgi:hypothetical protein